MILSISIRGERAFSDADDTRERPFSLSRRCDADHAERHGRAGVVTLLAVTTPEQLRNQADRLREVARTIRQHAAALDDDPQGVLDNYPDTRDGVWVGPAADEFYRQLRGVLTNLRNLRTDVQGYATECTNRAAELDREADELEAQLAAQDS
jgi:hypothetical protein